MRTVQSQAEARSLGLLDLDAQPLLLAGHGLPEEEGDPAMRAIKIYRSRRYTIVGLDEFKPGKDPALRVERVKELARRCGVQPGTTIIFKKLGSGYTRYGDAERLSQRRGRIRLRWLRRSASP